MIAAIAFVTWLGAAPEPTAAQPARALEVLPPRAPVSSGHAPTPALGPSLRPRPFGVAPVDAHQAKLEAQAHELGLRRRGRGWAYAGTPDERFDATIHRDGTVEFDIDPTIAFELDGVCLTAICGRTRKGQQQQRRGTSKRAARTAATVLAEAALGTLTGTFTYGRSRAPTIPGGREREREIPPPLPVAYAQGRYGHLPAPIGSMREFLERTFELRLQLAEDAIIEDLEARHARLPGELSELWADETRTDPDKRAEILQIWAELDQGLDHDDDVLAEALGSRVQARRDALATEGRAAILDSVRRHAPKGSRRAFTKAELSAFAAREDAGVAFEPYADPAPAP